MNENKNKPVKREDFLEGMSRVAQTVSIVTTGGPAGRAGVTISAMCSVSADPPMVLVCMHHQSRAVPNIQQNKIFCINVLADSMEDFANIFASIASAEEMFKTGAWETAVTGAPVLRGALASFDCRVGEIHRAGSHFIFLANVEKVILGDGQPLIYGARSYGTPFFFEKKK